MHKTLQAAHYSSENSIPSPNPLDNMPLHRRGFLAGLVKEIQETVEPLSLENQRTIAIPRMVGRGWQGKLSLNFSSHTRGALTSAEATGKLGMSFLGPRHVRIRGQRAGKDFKNNPVFGLSSLPCDSSMLSLALVHCKEWGIRVR